MKKIEFVSYTGKYPNYCSGRITLRIDGAEVTLPECSFMLNCAYVYKDLYDEYTPVNKGRWTKSYYFPAFLEPYYAEIEQIVNDNLHCCHCGGCE